MDTWEHSWEPTWPGRPPGPGSLGQRIAGLRVDRGWTQQQLADRLGISRVAVSHLETDLNTPSERTVALLAGCFRMEPHDLVAAMSYPVAKADRLPLVVTRHTAVELEVRLLDRDLELAESLGRPALLEGWPARLAGLRRATLDRRQLELVAQAEARLRSSRRATGP
ncbi:MAG: helix-turn-helix transcriptional regulator [Acidimicrobiia bacterium]|nr:helix-turn-helix transcriptional regulator [Acidimicrobiia bacterium]